MTGSHVRRLRWTPLLAMLAAALGAMPTPAAEAPRLSGRTLDGAGVSLAALRGQVVIVHYWATWCAPCRIEMPVLDAFYRSNRGKGLAMLAVGMDAGGPVKKLSAATAGFGFPVARIDDLAMPRSSIPTALPDTRVYDRGGTLRFDSKSLKGRLLDAATLDRVVVPLLAGSHDP